MDHALTRIDADPAGRPGIAFLALRGDVDACDLPALERVRRRLPLATSVHVDLSAIRFTGAALLGFIAGLAGQVRAAGGALHLHGVSARLVRLLALVEMEGQFEFRFAGDATMLRLRPVAPSPPERRHA